MDRISKLPLGIIETILCFLPIQDATRTSILSKEWRYHWIKIPKLVFNEYTFLVPRNRGELSVLEQTFEEPSQRKVMTTRCKLFYAIYQVLLIHEGPLHEFTLCMGADESCVEIDHIIRHLTKKNTLRILKLDCEYPLQGYELPVSLFSLQQLTDLHLAHCAFTHEPSFYKFRILTTLSLERVETYDKLLLCLLSSCPVLNRLTLHCSNADVIYTGYTPVVDIFERFLTIEYLSVSFFTFLGFELKRVPKEIPTTLVKLKYLCMTDMCVNHKYGFPFLFLLLRCSPNLEKLKLELHDEDEDWLEEDDFCSIAIEDYSDITLEHLNELEIRHFHKFDIEFDFVMLMLANSPVLKKVTIFPCRECDEDGDIYSLEILSVSPCASPLVEIIFSRH